MRESESGSHLLVNMTVHTSLPPEPGLYVDRACGRTLRLAPQTHVPLDRTNDRMPWHPDCDVNLWHTGKNEPCLAVANGDLGPPAI